MTRLTSRALLICFVAYTAATALHFVHNAIFLDEYPNMPDWITRAEVYGSLGALMAIGMLGYVLTRFAFRVVGLVVIGGYAAFGFDGLAHYGLAPVSAHTFAMNLTIWLEVASAALLLTVVVGLVAAHLRSLGSGEQTARPAND